MTIQEQLAQRFARPTQPTQSRNTTPSFQPSAATVPRFPQATAPKPQPKFGQNIQRGGAPSFIPPPTATPKIFNKGPPIPPPAPPKATTVKSGFPGVPGTGALAPPPLVPPPPPPAPSGPTNPPPPNIVPRFAPPSLTPPSIPKKDPNRKMHGGFVNQPPKSQPPAIPTNKPRRRPPPKIPGNRQWAHKYAQQFPAISSLPIPTGFSREEKTFMRWRSC